MKKLLVLVVMLGLVVAANALTLTLRDDVNPKFDFNFDGTFLSLSTSTAFELADNGAYGLVYSGTGTLSKSGVVGYNNANNDFSFGIDPDATLEAMGLGNGVVMPLSTFGPNAPVAPINLVWNISVAPVAGDIITLRQLVDVTVNEETTTQLGGILYQGTFVPEPVTVALLGLGGLFIRRNKK